MDFFVGGIILPTQGIIEELNTGRGCEGKRSVCNGESLRDLWDDIQGSHPLHFHLFTKH